MNAEQYAQRRAKVCDLTEQGWGITQIAEHLGIPPRMVKYDRMVGRSTRPAKPFSAAEKEQAIAMLSGGSTYYTVAKALGRSQTAVRKNVPGYARDSDDAIERRRLAVARMTRQGMRVVDIAAALRINDRLVMRDRRVLGLSQPAPIPFTEAERIEAKARLDDGASYNEVARTIGRTHQTLVKHLPGYTWTPQQVAEAGAMGRAMARLDRVRAVA